MFHEDASLLLFLKPDGGIEPERYGDERQDGTETVGFDTDAFVAGQGEKITAAWLGPPSGMEERRRIGKRQMCVGVGESD